MGEFSHPAAQGLLAELRKAFEGDVFEKRKKFFLFVCGGPVDGKVPTLRLQFLKWSETELPDCVVILAEAAFKQTQISRLPRQINLTSFETLIAEAADFVVIFPESPGSFSEAGFFCKSRDIPTMTIVAIDEKYRGDASFLNLGPLRTFDSRSNFSPRVSVCPSNPNADFAVIKRKLDGWKGAARRQRFAYAPFSKLKSKQKLIVVLEMLYLLRLVTLEDLRYAIKETFGPASRDSIGRLLSILVGAEYVTDVNGRYALAKNRETMLEFDAPREEELVFRVMEYYQRNRPSLYNAITAWAAS